MSIANNKKVKFDGARCPFSTFLRLQGDHHCACAQKWCHFSFFSRAFKQKKIKAVRPKMTKIASRGGGSCLKTRLLSTRTRKENWKWISFFTWVMRDSLLLVSTTTFAQFLQAYALRAWSKSLALSTEVLKQLSTTLLAVSSSSSVCLPSKRSTLAWTEQRKIKLFYKSRTKRFWFGPNLFVLFWH